MVVGTIAFAGLGLLMAGTLRAEATLAVANGAYLLLLVLGGMAYPLAKLPLALQDLARVLPAAPLAECLRGALTGSGIPGARLAILARLGRPDPARWPPAASAGRSNCDAASPDRLGRRRSGAGGGRRRLAGR